MTASAIFTAAHLAAKVADKAMAYRTRFATALKSAWAAAKQTINTVMSTILETIENPSFSADLANPVTASYDVYHVAGNAAFVVRRLSRAGAAPRVMVATNRAAISTGNQLFARNGEAFYSFGAIDQLDARDLAALNITAADVAAATAAINA